jgi:hypothetical protein
LKNPYRALVFFGSLQKLYKTFAGLIDAIPLGTQPLGRSATKQHNKAIRHFPADIGCFQHFKN